MNKGEARTLTFQYGIWSFTSGDASIRSANINAFINQADYADYEYTNILLGLYQSVTVSVYGQQVTDKEFIQTMYNGD